MIGGVDDDRSVREAGLGKRNQDSSHIVVDQRDLAVGVGNDLPQLCVRLRCNAAVLLADVCVFRCPGGLRRDDGLVPPGPAIEIPLAIER